MFVGLVFVKSNKTKIQFEFVLHIIYLYRMKRIYREALLQ